MTEVILTEPSNSDSESDSETSLISSEDDADYYTDLAETLKQEIEDEEYVCLICTGEIGISSKVWACNNCYRVYDMDCIKSWSQRGLKESIERGQVKKWRCPSCNNVSNREIKQYRCWCGKLTDPYYNGLIPHSCGQTCGAKLKSCVHKCSIMCHPGPHAECTAMGPAMSCKCGKNVRQWPCIITPYEYGWQCKEECGEIMPCGDHKCAKKCHDRLCGACMELISATCYCGKTSGLSNLPCSERRPDLSETVDSKWIGEFFCDELCDQPLSCGIHKCALKCHSRQLGDHQCPDSPPEKSGVEACPCGKTLVKDILSRERASCLEEVPACDKTCGKVQSCGHECPGFCHTGPCPPCRRIVTVKCGCQTQIFDVPCRFKTNGDKARCNRKCTALMDCRRHRCNRLCCEYEKQALDRERNRKKKLRGRSLEDSNPNNDDENIEPVHSCQEVCNKLLNCGKHRCVMTCHNGSCLSCLESTLEDWSCDCGQTTVAAPIRCGMEMPKCKFKCSRPTFCGHPPVDHECHGPSQSCPRCSYLVERQCVCGRAVIKGVQCSIPTVSCGRACGKKMKCGHSCTKVCHKDGECQTVCKSACGRVRPCNHLDIKHCHGETGLTCTEANGPCPENVTIRCKCGNLRENRTCNGEENQPELECDASCEALERSRKLAEALDIDFEEKLKLKELHKYDDLLLDIYYADQSYGDMIERQMIDFINNDEAKTYRYPAMRSDKRQFVHILAAELGLKSESQDSEPKRSVVVSRTNDVHVPSNRLRESTNPFQKYI